MKEEPQEPTELCGAKGENLRGTCDLPKGHVKTADDWHHLLAISVKHDTTNSFRTHTSITEEIEWRPNMFELPPEARTRAISALLGDPDE